MAAERSPAATDGVVDVLVNNAGIGRSDADLASGTRAAQPAWAPRPCPAHAEADAVDRDLGGGPAGGGILASGAAGPWGGRPPRASISHATPERSGGG